jgi:omega-amidase
VLGKKRQVSGDLVKHEDESSGSTITVVLGEIDTGWHDATTSLDRAESIVGSAAEMGAKLVVLPEMLTTGFTMNPAQVVEEEDGPSLKRLSAIATANKVAVIAGIATRSGAGCEQCFHNAAIVFDENGTLRGRYRKQKLLAVPAGGSRESSVYKAGDKSLVVELNGVRIGVFICFDLRFPELFRAVAREVHAMAVIANWPAVRQMHWETLLRARAIENQCFVVAVNRIGTADGIEYQGGSAIIDPWGTVVSAPDSSGILHGTISTAVVARIRKDFPVGLS